jgi:hypothetical protein
MGADSFPEFFANSGATASKFPYFWYVFSELVEVHMERSEEEESDGDIARLAATRGCTAVMPIFVVETTPSVTMKN